MYLHRCQIFKSSHGDCSNNGISSRCDYILLAIPDNRDSSTQCLYTTEDRKQIEAEMAKLDNGLQEIICIVINRNLYGCGLYHHVEPFKHSGQYMFGGTLIYSSDSRFPFVYPVKLHDRRE